MKCWTSMLAGFIGLILWAAPPSGAMAGSGEKIKDGARETVSEIGKEAVRAGRAAAGTGREIKEGAVKAGATVKEGAIEVGRNIKKAVQETRDAVAREFSGDAPRGSSGH